MIDYELFLDGVEEERQRTQDFKKFGVCPECRQNPADTDGLCNICDHLKKEEATNDKLD